MLVWTGLEESGLAATAAAALEMAAAEAVESTEQRLRCESVPFGAADEPLTIGAGNLVVLLGVL